MSEELSQRYCTPEPLLGQSGPLYGASHSSFHTFDTSKFARHQIIELLRIYNLNCCTHLWRASKCKTSSTPSIHCYRSIASSTKKSLSGHERLPVSLGRLAQVSKMFYMTGLHTKYRRIELSFGWGFGRRIWLLALIFNTTRPSAAEMNFSYTRAS